MSQKGPLQVTLLTYAPVAAGGIRLGWHWRGGCRWGDGLAPRGPGAAPSQGGDGQAALPRCSLRHNAWELCFRCMVHPVEDLRVT